jgi:hypothetical protein
MKLTTEKLKQLIKEELNRIFLEEGVLNSMREKKLDLVLNGQSLRVYPADAAELEAMQEDYKDSNDIMKAKLEPSMYAGFYLVLKGSELEKQIKDNSEEYPADEPTRYFIYIQNESHYNVLKDNLEIQKVDRADDIRTEYR